MTFSDSIAANVGGRKTILLLLLFFALLMGASPEALACQAQGGLIDGFVDAVPPSQIQIDGNCTIRNFPASNPLTTNFSFYTQPGQTDERWLITFDNVVHTGQMACNAVHGHKIWFTNGSSSAIQEGCQNLLIPVEKINKQNPAGQTTATIGVPHLHADDSGPVRPGNGHRHRLQRVAERPARHHDLGRPQRHGRGSQLCELRRLLA
jgi:hypothetical protein